MKCYSWDPVKLADAYTLEQLSALRLEVEAEPRHRTPVGADGRPVGTIYIFTKPARRKLDAIGWAIYHVTRRLRAERGDPVSTPGLDG